MVSFWNTLTLGATNIWRFLSHYYLVSHPALEFIWKTEMNHIPTKQVPQINNSFYQFSVILNIVKKTSIYHGRWCFSRFIKIFWKRKKWKCESLGFVLLFATPWLIAHQAPLSMGFSRQEHWSVLPFPSPKHESEKWKWSRSVVSDS